MSSKPVPPWLHLARIQGKNIYNIIFSILNLIPTAHNRHKGNCLLAGAHIQILDREAVIPGAGLLYVASRKDRNTGHPGSTVESRVHSQSSSHSLKLYRHRLVTWLSCPVKVPEGEYICCMSHEHMGVGPRGHVTNPQIAADHDIRMI